MAASTTTDAACSRKEKDGIEEQCSGITNELT
jgi:hypothetical protein